ncbi:Uncharacterised protein [Mycobacteroides abscessus]|nr:Uncharacterised protein [Mycobacteroides abscessus]
MLATRATGNVPAWIQPRRRGLTTSATFATASPTFSRTDSSASVPDACAAPGSAGGALGVRSRSVGRSTTSPRWCVSGHGRGRRGAPTPTYAIVSYANVGLRSVPAPRCEDPGQGRAERSGPAGPGTDER